MTNTILIIDDSVEFTALLARQLAREGYEVQTAHSGAVGLRLATERRPRLVLLDLHLADMSGLDVLHELADVAPETAVAIVTAHPELSSALAAIKGHVVDYLCKPFPFDELRSVLRKVFAVRPGGSGAVDRATTEVAERPETEMIGTSSAIAEVRTLLRQLAVSGVRAVLITGESGTGKDLAARLLHTWGPRGHAPFVEVNCSAVSGELFESEFFGHERGAFTGAIRSRRGFAELADGGTLFLDEVAEIPLGCQPKLLRFLEDGTFSRVGGGHKMHVDAQIVAATNRDLRAMVEQWAFRQDLYFRLNVVPIVLPPLRRRPEDIMPLARYWLAQANVRYGKKVREFTRAAETLLYAHPWPGNVRELRNLVERLVILCPDDQIEAAHFPAEYREGSAAPAPPAAAAPLAGDSDAGTLQRLEREHIQRVLASVNGNKTRAAAILGISRSTLRAKVAALEIPAPSEGQ